VTAAESWQMNSASDIQQQSIFVAMPANMLGGLADTENPLQKIC
jgi:hypothetical protein